MKNLLIILSFALLVTPSFSQDKPEVKNVDLGVKNNHVIVNYDLLGKPDSEYEVGLFFLDRSYNVVTPYSITGDYGKNITPGRKEIVWDIAQDKTELSRKLRPKVVLQNVETRLGGPRNAWLSVLVPGLGDYYVKNPDDMVIKPYMRTISALGLVGLGINASIQRKEVPLTSTQREEYFNRTEWEWEVRYHEVIHGYETNYWLFKNDTEFLLAAGTAIWIADIIWVFAEGRANSKIRHIYSNVDLEMNYFGGMNVGYTLKF